MIGRLNHVAIAVQDLAAATAIYRGTLGAEVSDAVSQPDHGVTTVFVELHGAIPQVAPKKVNGAARMLNTLPMVAVNVIGPRWALPLTGMAETVPVPTTVNEPGNVMVLIWPPAGPSFLRRWLTWTSTERSKGVCLRW